jgi:transcriptional regulator with XRE-family HTH domain
MAKMPINQVLAANLTHFMGEQKLSQAALGRKVGLSQRTIGNYMNPDLRDPVGKTGKARSAKLSEVELIATGLGVEVWELLRPLSPAERAFYRQIEESFTRLRSMAPTLEPHEG